MHKLQMYENLRDMLEQEVKDIEKKGDLDLQGLDNLYKLMTALKVTDRCIEREQKESGMSMGGMSNNSYGGSYRGGGGSYNSYADATTNNQMMPSYDYRGGGGSYESRGGGSYRGGSYGGGSYDGMSNDGMSNEGGQSNARRGRDGDGDGRYNESRESRDNFRNSEDRGQSYESSYGYSRDATKKKMVQKLETLMDDTMSEHERKAIMDCINKIK